MRRLFELFLGIPIFLFGLLFVVCAVLSYDSQSPGTVHFVVLAVLLTLAGSYLLVGTSKKNWRTLPPTEKQINYARDLGIKFNPKRITRGELSDLIDENS